MTEFAQKGTMDRNANTNVNAEMVQGEFWAQIILDFDFDFFMLTLLRRASFDHHLWSIFQSSLTYASPVSS